MDKRTIFAIVICTGIFIIWMMLQQFFGQGTVKPEISDENNTKKSEIVSDTGAVKAEAFDRINPVDEELSMEKEFTVSESEYNITFSTKGALVKSLELNKYKDIDGTPIEMIISQDSGLYPFAIFFGDYSTKDDIFTYSKDESSKEYKFSKVYKYRGKDSDPDIFFKITKIYSFTDPYIIDLSITIESQDRTFYIPLNFDNQMYTLTFGPQIGPEVDKIDNTNEIRRYYYLGSKRQNINNKVDNSRKEKRYVIDKDVKWVAIEGKYFVVIADPPSDFTENHVGVDTTPVSGLFERSSLFFMRPYEERIKIDESFKFYLGPKIDNILKQYSNYDFQKIKGFNPFGWIVVLLRYLLTFLHRIVKNWGVAIIIMTIIIKVLFFPLTQKGFQSTTKMQALNPKIEELKVKYKDNPQKMQAEMGALYKEHGINPLAGCLPWLIQIPIFIGLFTMLRNQFDLRGAVFISGWINDLSAPENLLKLPFVVPFTNWTHLNILPFFMTAMMVVQQKFTQTPSAASASGGNQMKILMLAMPAIFFFICYNMPSGLVLYWTVQSAISLFQQILVNNLQKNKKEESVPQKFNINRMKKKKKK